MAWDGSMGPVRIAWLVPDRSEIILFVLVVLFYFLIARCRILIICLSVYSKRQMKGRSMGRRAQEQQATFYQQLGNNTCSRGSQDCMHASQYA